MSDEKTTHFGFDRIPSSEKNAKVAGVFDSVATQYDLMNDLMSLGIHRLWKSHTIRRCRVKPHHKVLDLAAGTADLSLAIAKTLNQQGNLVLADINAEMLTHGEARLMDSGLIDRTSLVQCNAEYLPFPDHYFDRILIAFGLRNVTDQMNALNEMRRCLKPGGIALILEFSQPNPFLQPIYDAYSFHVLPKLGSLIANDADSYRYLAESIRMHPNQDTLKNMMTDAGFDQADYENLTGGIVALHTGVKY